MTRLRILRLLLGLGLGLAGVACIAFNYSREEFTYVGALGLMGIFIFVMVLLDVNIFYGGTLDKRLDRELPENKYLSPREREELETSVAELPPWVEFINRWQERRDILGGYLVLLVLIVITYHFFVMAFPEYSICSMFDVLCRSPSPEAIHA